MDHWAALKDTEKAIYILHTLLEIPKLALSYRPEKKVELQRFSSKVEDEISKQRQLLKKLEERKRLVQPVYKEERRDIEDAHKEATTIKREIAQIGYEEKIERINAVLKLLQRNRSYIEGLLSGPGEHRSLSF